MGRGRGRSGGPGAERTAGMKGRFVFPVQLEQAPAARRVDASLDQGVVKPTSPPAVGPTEHCPDQAHKRAHLESHIFAFSPILQLGKLRPREGRGLTGALQGTHLGLGEGCKERGGEHRTPGSEVCPLSASVLAQLGTSDRAATQCYRGGVGGKCTVPLRRDLFLPVVCLHLRPHRSRPDEGRSAQHSLYSDILPPSRASRPNVALSRFSVPVHASTPPTSLRDFGTGLGHSAQA